jgi:hypothetical protein
MSLVPNIKLPAALIPPLTVNLFVKDVDVPIPTLFVTYKSFADEIEPVLVVVILLVVVISPVEVIFLTV